MLGGQSKCGDGAHWGMECVWGQGALGGQGEGGVGMHVETRSIWGIEQGQGALEEWGMCEVGVHAETGCTGGMGQGWGAWGDGAHWGTGHMKDRGWGGICAECVQTEDTARKGLETTACLEYPSNS